MHQYCFTYLMVKLRGMEMFRQSLKKARNAVTGGHELWENTCATLSCARRARTQSACAALDCWERRRAGGLPRAL